MSHYNPEDGGVQFDPYDDELIKKYLIPKLNGEECPSGDKIVMKDVYAKEPWLLDHTRGSFFKNNEWYYFTTSTQVSKKKPGHGQKAKRRIIGNNDGWTWKSNTQEDIIDEETGEIIGKKQKLKFTNTSSKNKMQKRRDGTSCDTIVRGSDSSWIMTEYMLPDEDKFQELVLCKIRWKSNKKDNDHEASTYHHHIDSSTSEQPPMSCVNQTVSSPSLEQQQPSLCGGGGPANPHMGFPSSLTCHAAETERNKEHSGEGNMIDRIDTFSMIDAVPERSSQKAMEVTQEIEEDWIGDLIDKYKRYGIEAVLSLRPQRSNIRSDSAPVTRVFNFSDLGI